MGWTAYLGRIALAVGVIALAVWATANKLIDIPAYQFWTGIVSYLVAAEVVWTLVERRWGGTTPRRPHAGLIKLAARERPVTVLPDWLHEGGRVRRGDIAAGHDSPRETLPALHTAVMARVGRLSTHRLTAAPGSGRSVLLRRLGAGLAEAGQPTFLISAAAQVASLEPVVEQARRQQAYLLVDDLDLRPEAEAWLYELHRSQLPIVVVATTAAPGGDADHRTGAAGITPASLLSAAVSHDVSVTHNDVVALSRKLTPREHQQRVGLTLEESDSLLAAARAFRGVPVDRGLWPAIDATEALAAPAALMLALMGTAEIALSERLWTTLFGPASLRPCLRGLVAQEDDLVLPPHRLACLEHLQQAAPADVAAALRQLCDTNAAEAPALAPRLLYALAQLPPTRALARACLQERRDSVAPASEAIARLWRTAADAVGLPADADDATTYPPEVSTLAHSALANGELGRALALSRRLVGDPAYARVARFNAALALARQGDVAAAEEELSAVGDGVRGAHYLRGVLAEMRGDVLRALDHYEASRKADEMLLPSTHRLADAYIKAGAPRSAIPLFEALLAYDPLDADLYGGLAVAHLHAGMAQRAAAQSARAIQAGVEPVVARKAVARACAAVHAYARVLPELEACLSYDHNDMEAWAALAEACRWLGRFAREEECLRWLQDRRPDDEELRLQMARCQRDQGRPEEALEWLQPLLAQDQPALLALLLGAEVTTGDASGQRAFAARAMARGDESGWAAYWVSDSHGEMTDEATAAARAAIMRMQQEIERGATPRNSASLWQAIYLMAERLGDDGLAAQAARRACQEAAICEALGAEIHSVTHRRSVPPDLFLDSLPPRNATPASAPPANGDADRTLPRLTSTPNEASAPRNRRLRGPGV